MPKVHARWTSALLALLVAGCAPEPAPRPVPTPPPAELAGYLSDPTAGLATTTPEVVSTREAHDRLLRTGQAGEARRALESLVAEHPDFAPARVALAQALLVAGDAAGAAAQARAAGTEGGLAGALVLGRALETAGDASGAALAFARAAEVSSIASAAVARLRPEASAALAARAAAAIERGRHADAQAALDDLARLEPRSRRTLELRQALAAATGDARAELQLLRALTADEQGSRLQRLRRADLELEIGDAAAGLAIVQSLAEASPADASLAEHLRRARFRWRVLNAPEPVRRAAGEPRITRAGGAVLLYWLLPQVRTGGGGEARIASDVLDHPAREEIVRVVNLGLLSVDDTLHTFGPDRLLRRSEMLAALLRVLAREPTGAGCAAPADASGESLGTCARAASCGLVPSADDCLAGAPLSGAEALAMIRQATERLERP